MKLLKAMCILCCIVLALGTVAFAEGRIVDYTDLSDYTALCEQFGSYSELGKAFLCAACIPYGATPEECVEELKNKGFEFEYHIYADMPVGATTADFVYSDDGTVEVYLMRELEMVFSPGVILCARTEASLVPVKEMEGYPKDGLWTPDGEPPTGQIVSAHLEFIDEETQEYVTWTFAPHEEYMKVK